MSSDPLHEEPAKATEPIHVEEISDLLNAEIEQVREWLREEDIEPVEPGDPDRYDRASLERLRARQQM